MSYERSVLLVLVAIWAGLFAASYFMSVRIDGPRNIDTGFRRLDVLFRYQLFAFGVAVLSMVMGFVWRKSGKRMLLTGAMPLLTTIALVAALFVAVTLYGSGSPSENSGAPKISAPSAAAILGDD